MYRRLPHAVIYARFSSHLQREESIDAQVRAVREFAIRQHMVIVGEYIDRGKSCVVNAAVLMLVTARQQTMAPGSIFLIAAREVMARLITKTERSNEMIWKRSFWANCCVWYQVKRKRV